jgi:hypothetical protein
MPIWHYFAIRAFGYASDVYISIWAHASDLVRDRRAVARFISLVIPMIFALYETSAFLNLTSERALAVYTDVKIAMRTALGWGSIIIWVSFLRRLKMGSVLVSSS